VSPSLRISQEQIAEFCHRYRICRLALFGSVLRDDFNADSDVDVLVEFEPGWTPGLGIVDVEEELSHLFGDHRADMVNPKYLNPRIRDRVLASAETIYEQG
jgi:predicted nucleotidyltransferase